MLYVRKGMFGTGLGLGNRNVASAAELTKEFYRAADSISEIDHLMIGGGALDRDNFSHPAESSRAPSATHTIQYTSGGGVTGAVLQTTSAISAPSNLVEFGDVGNGIYTPVLDGTAAPSSALELNIFLSDAATVLISATCQYSAGGTTDHLMVEAKITVNGSGGRARCFSTEIGGLPITANAGLSLIDTWTLPGGNHVIGMQARQFVSPVPTAVAPTLARITAATISAVGFYR